MPIYFHANGNNPFALVQSIILGGSVGGGDVGDRGVVKVGGVDTEMYRTGHPHACSINLTTILLQLLWRAEGAERFALLRRDDAESGESFFFTLITDH